MNEARGDATRKDEGRKRLCRDLRRTTRDDPLGEGG